MKYVVNDDVDGVVKGALFAHPGEDIAHLAFLEPVALGHHGAVGFAQDVEVGFLQVLQRDLAEQAPVGKVGTLLVKQN